MFSDIIQTILRNPRGAIIFSTPERLHQLFKQCFEHCIHYEKESHDDNSLDYLYIYMYFTNFTVVAIFSNVSTRFPFNIPDGIWTEQFKLEYISVISPEYGEVSIYNGLVEYYPP